VAEEKRRGERVIKCSTKHRVELSVLARLGGSPKAAHEVVPQIKADPDLRVNFSHEMQLERGQEKPKNKE